MRFVQWLSCCDPEETDSYRLFVTPRGASPTAPYGTHVRVALIDERGEEHSCTIEGPKMYQPYSIGLSGLFPPRKRLNTSRCVLLIDLMTHQPHVDVSRSECLVEIARPNQTAIRFRPSRVIAGAPRVACRPMILSNQAVNLGLISAAEGVVNIPITMRAMRRDGTFFSTSFCATARPRSVSIERMTIPEETCIDSPIVVDASIPDQLASVFVEQAGTSYGVSVL